MKNTALFDVAKNLLQNRCSKMEQREKVLSETHAQLIALLLRTYLTSKDQHALDEMFFLFFGVKFREFYDKVSLELFNQHMAAELEEFEKIQRMTVEEYYYTHFVLPIHEQQKKERLFMRPFTLDQAWPKEYYDDKPMGRTLIMDMRNIEVGTNDKLQEVKNPDPHAGTYGFSGTDEYPDRIDLAIEYMKSPEYLESVEAEEAQKYPEFKIAEEMALPMELFGNNFEVYAKTIINNVLKQKPDKLPENRVEFDLAMKKPADKPKVNGDNEIVLERIEQMKRKRVAILKLPKSQRGELQLIIDMINRLKTWLN